MKKRNFKSLQLNKHAISNLRGKQLKGGNSDHSQFCETDLGSCDWFVCPFSDPIFTDCLISKEN